jgi:hypothetical protein
VGDARTGLEINASTVNVIEVKCIGAHRRGISAWTVPVETGAEANASHGALENESEYWRWINGLDNQG